jgi:hypothetical protein
MLYSRSRQWILGACDNPNVFFENVRQRSYSTGEDHNFPSVPEPPYEPYNGLGVTLVRQPR